MADWLKKVLLFIVTVTQLPARLPRQPAHPRGFYSVYAAKVALSASFSLPSHLRLVECGCHHTFVHILNVYQGGIKSMSSYQEWKTGSNCLYIPSLFDSNPFEVNTKIMPNEADFPIQSRLSWLHVFFDTLFNIKLYTMLQIYQLQLDVQQFLEK